MATVKEGNGPAVKATKKTAKKKAAKKKTVQKKDPPKQEEGKVMFVSWREIKWNEKKGQVNLKWTERADNAPKEKTETVGHEYFNVPKTAMSQALKDLRKHVAAFVAITGAEKAKLIEQLEVRGALFSEDSNGEKAQLVVVRRIPLGDKTAVQNFNTPAWYTYVNDDEADLIQWDADAMKVIDRLKDAAKAYKAGGS